MYVEVYESTSLPEVEEERDRSSQHSEVDDPIFSLSEDETDLSCFDGVT